MKDQSFPEELHPVSKCIRGCCSSKSLLLGISKSRIKFKREIARGAESVVYEAEYDQKLVAAKKPRLYTADDLDRFHVELQLLTKLKHSNISTLVAVNAHPPDYFFLFKLYENGNLSHALHVKEISLSSTQLLKISLQLASALEYVHSLGIVHRDVKPANILLDSNWDSHLSDFGLASYADELKLLDASSWKSQGKPTGGFHKKNMVGTLLYMAPEVLNKEPHTLKSDVYSFAITLNELFTGVVPYTDRKTEAQAHTVLEMNYTEQKLSAAVASEGLRPVLATESNGCPAALSSLIEQCWHRDPLRRPSFDFILERLQHISRTADQAHSNKVLKPAAPRSGLNPLQEVDWAARALEHSENERADEFLVETILFTKDVEYTPTLSWGVFRTRGGREFMEDRHFLLPNIGGSRVLHAFGVFDGHRGYEAAEFAASAVPRFLSGGFSLRPEEALASAFVKTDVAFRLEVESEKSLSRSSLRDWNPGCTALTALFINEKLYVANAGDCRAVLSRHGEAFLLSKDHTASDASERNRVIKAGGSVQWKVDNWRVGSAGLQVTRSIGDCDLKPAVTAEPEIFETSLTEADEFLVLASDGLWDTVSEERVVSLVKDTVKDPGMCAKRLATEAVERGSRDNITVIVVFLQPVSTVERVY